MNLITIGDIEFDAEDRTTWSAMDLRGWKGSPPMRADVNDRPNQDGAFGSVKNFRSARVLTFSGVLEGGTTITQLELEDRFAAIQADGSPIPISVENDLGKRTATGSLQGAAEIVPDSDHKGATLTARFVCYDPLKYGPAETSDPVALPAGGGGLEYELGEPSEALYYGALGNLGRVELTNEGTAPTWPDFFVTGELATGFKILSVETGQFIQFSRTVPDGTSVYLSSRTRTALVDGVSDASTSVTYGDWFSIGPGETITVQFSALSTGNSNASLIVTHQSGWW